KYNDLVREGDYYRIASFSKNKEYDAWEVAAKDGSECLVAYVSVNAGLNRKGRALKLYGLDKDAVYREEETGMTYHGDTLMNAGIYMKEMKGDFRSKLVHFTRV
ncbi:MAG: GH36 C-terminal domain-containing protein, partial [Lachnospiraceae bacterium]|nr:GH36 C-terminal domain-containing protein [Lachnospiraceae bacterium]